MNSDGHHQQTIGHSNNIPSESATTHTTFEWSTISCCAGPGVIKSCMYICAYSQAVHESLPDCLLHAQCAVGSLQTQLHEQEGLYFFAKSSHCGYNRLVLYLYGSIHPPTHPPQNPSMQPLLNKYSLLPQQIFQPQGWSARNHKSPGGGHWPVRVSSRLVWELGRWYVQGQAIQCWKKQAQGKHAHVLPFACFQHIQQPIAKSHCWLFQADAQKHCHLALDSKLSQQVLLHMSLRFSASSSRCVSHHLHHLHDFCSHSGLCTDRTHLYPHHFCRPALFLTGSQTLTMQVAKTP